MRMQRRPRSFTRRSSSGSHSSPSRSCGAARATHVAAIGLVLAGQAWLAGEPRTVAFGCETMILAATLFGRSRSCSSKRLLDVLAPRSLAAARMAVGTVVLVGWLALTGRVSDLLALGAEQWGWAAPTGLLLAATSPAGTRRLRAHRPST